MSADDHQFRLDPRDEHALAWLMDHGLDPTDALPEIQDRASRLAALFSLASRNEIEHSDALTDHVLSLLNADRGVRYELCEADQDALDAIMMTGMNVGKVPASLRDRADRINAMVGLTGTRQTEHDAALTDRVLAAVDASAAELDANRPVIARLRGRFADVISVAAVILIATSVIWPVLNATRDHAIKRANQANLAVAGLGFGSYAADFEGSLPRLSDRDHVPGWWNVGEDPNRSNSAGLFTLARLRYTPLEALASPGNPNALRIAPAEEAFDWSHADEVSYSYLLPRARQISFDQRAVLLADRSPIIVRLMSGQPARVSENSPNHDGRGQHMLHGDGSVVWTTEPYTEQGDHVYLPRVIERAVESFRRQLDLQLERMPPPSDRADVFLGP